jgi:hypothetical protein
VYDFEDWLVVLSFLLLLKNIKIPPKRECIRTGANFYSPSDPDSELDSGISLRFFFGGFFAVSASVSESEPELCFVFRFFSALPGPVLDFRFLVLLLSSVSESELESELELELESELEPELLS